jgi:hypothetical protein
MRNRLVVCFAVAGLSWSQLGQAQQVDPPSDAELAAISARGRALAGYDAAAWHATDAVEPLNPPKEAVQLYVARKTENGWVVMWGRFNELKTKFLIAYEAREGASPTEYKVIQHKPAIEDGDVYYRAAKALETARADFRNRSHPQVPYNISVLPGPSDGWYVYAIPAQTDNALLPYGADVRYAVSANGEAITETRQMHGILLENFAGRATWGFHTHVLSDVPEDSDVFYAMSLNAAHGNWIATKKYVYAINTNGLINCVGKTEDVVKRLQDGEFTEMGEPYRSMLLANMQGLLGIGPPEDPVEAFVSLSGQKCKGTTPWLKFSIVLTNTTERRMILNRRALWNAQIRFGASDADILAGKYEKMVVFIPDKGDYADEKAFFLLAPGMVYSEDREYAALGTDLKGKSAVQFLFFSWPPTDEDQIEAQRTRWAKAGYLYTDDIVTSPVSLKLDPELVNGCRSK